MAGTGSDDVHVREELGLYLLGELKGDERDRVERHLARCADCCIEADELGAEVEPLALVTPQYVRDLIAEFGALPEDSGPTSGRSD